MAFPSRTVEPLLPPGAPRPLPVLGEQRDIRYIGSVARSILNPPATTGMRFWSINPYTGCAFGCAYCYARYAHRYAFERTAAAGRLSDAAAGGELPPWLAFERRIFVKENAPALLAHALRAGGRSRAALERGETLVIGTATDPYQPAERRYRVTRGLLEVLAAHGGLRVVIITKSPLITRDVDLLHRIARHSTLTVHLSLITTRRALARRLEPRAPTPESRLRALRRLREAGIRAGVNCMPVLPGITDHPRDLEELVRQVADAGASFVGTCALRLQRSARERYLPFIAREFPELSGRYEAAYAHGPEVSERYRSRLSQLISRLCRKYGVGEWEDDTAAGTREAGATAGIGDAASSAAAAASLRTAPGATQLQLAL